MTLKNELIYKVLKASDDLRGLDLFPQYEISLKLKSEDKIELVAKEEVMVRILNANANYDGINLDDVLVQSLKNKDKRTAREELIQRALRADNNLYGIKLDDLYSKILRLNPDITFRETVIIRMLDYMNDDLEFFNFDDIAEKILRFIEKNKRTLRQQLLYKIYNKQNEDLLKSFS